ncbi:MAG: MFS transporter [Sporichthyaceae bacterium]
MNNVDDAPSVPIVKNHRITHWDPEDEYFWANGGSKIAKRNMICSVIVEHFGFAVWTMWSSLILFLGPQYGLTPDQKFLLVSVPAAVGGVLRIPYSMAVAKFGGRDWTIVSAALLLLPTITAFFLLKPGVDFGVLLMLVALAGVGGGNFASSMSNINAFYPERSKGFALGINAAAGNLGVAVAQLLGLFVLVQFGVGHPRILVGIYIPVVVVITLIAALYMDNLVHQVNDSGAVREACREPHTWIISLLYIGTFGSFIGFSFAFGQVLLVQFPEHFSKVVTIAGVTKTVPDPVQAAYLTFLGPLIGSVARPFGGWLADRKGGSVVTFWAFIAMTGGALVVLSASLAGSLPLFIVGFTLLFVIAGLANGSCYKMIPVLFRGRAAAAIDSGTDPKLALAHARRRTGAVIGIAGAIGAFGGLGVNIALRQSFLHNKNGNAAYVIFIGFYVLCALITWAVYLRTRRTTVEDTPSMAVVRPARIATLVD